MYITVTVHNCIGAHYTVPVPIRIDDTCKSFRKWLHLYSYFIPKLSNLFQMSRILHFTLKLNLRTKFSSSIVFKISTHVVFYEYVETMSQYLIVNTVVYLYIIDIQQWIATRLFVYVN